MKILFTPRQINMFKKYANPQFKVSDDYKIIDKVLNTENIIIELSKDRKF
jgi:hypothetical protein